MEPKYVSLDESKIVEDMDEKAAAAFLLLANVLCFGEADISWNPNIKMYTACLLVNCSDVFAWGCSDAEPITESDGEEPSEMIELYKLVKEDKDYGSVKWVCLKRNEQPQDPLKKIMIEAGSWNEKMESLPENQHNKAIREHAKKSSPKI